MEIFNLCCKIGKISFWHGTHRGNESLGRNANPLNAIKRAVTAYHLNKDLTLARSKDNLFTTLYLQNNTTYKNRYFLAKPFTSSGTFHNSSARLKFIKVLLSTKLSEKLQFLLDDLLQSLNASAVCMPSSDFCEGNIKKQLTILWMSF